MKIIFIVIFNFISLSLSTKFFAKVILLALFMGASFLVCLIILYLVVNFHWKSVCYTHLNLQQCKRLHKELIIICSDTLRLLSRTNTTSFLFENFGLKVKESESEAAQSRLTLCDPVDCSPPGSSIHGILQARILEWVAISFSAVK